MKLKLFCFALLIVATTQSCKKAIELKNQLVEAYWQNVDGVVLQFTDTEAYVLDAAGSVLDSDPTVFDVSNMPYIKNIMQTGSGSYTGDIVKTTITNGKISSINYENTIITITEEDGKLVLTFSNADTGAGAWTAMDDDPGSNPDSPAVPRDTTSTMLKDSNSSFTVASSNMMQYPSTFTNFAVYGRYRPLSYVPGRYYYRMDANVNSNSNWPLTFYFKEKPSVSKVYKAVSGSMASMVGVSADEVGIEWNTYFEAESGPTVSVDVSGGKITLTGNNIKTSKLTAVYDDYLTFKIIGQ